MKFQDNRLSSVFTYFQLQLGDLYPEKEVRNLAKMSIEDIFGYDAAFLATHPDEKLTESEMLKIVFLMKKLKTGMPIQYALGYAHFMDLELKVNEHTLIPRPETEELVSWILSSTSNKKDFKILDIGTGSGCIALALKTRLTKASITASDISSEALEIAEENADHLNLEITFIKDNILIPSALKSINSLDIIVSNPPYVTDEEASLLHKNVLDFEPHRALFVPNDDGLIYYRHIISFAQDKLNSGGWLYFEINEKYGQETLIMLEKVGFTQLELKKDLSGKDRMVRARLL